MSDQKKNINCRVCLRYDLKGSQKCFSLFEKFNNSLISEKIQYVANVEIRESDGLPSKICPDCLLQLETAIVFKQKCETSNKILRSVLLKPSKECKVTFGVPVKKEVEVLFENTDNQSAEYSDTEPERIKPEKPSYPKEFENKEPEIEELEYDGTINVVELGEPDCGESEPEKSEETTETVKKSKAIDLKLICDDCGSSFKSKCKLAVHWKKVHLHSKLICPQCKRMFKTYKALNVHKKKNTRSCYVATKVHIEGQGRTRVFHCKECPYHTTHIKDMDAHLATHSGDRRYQCVDCFKCFTQHSSLQAHRESCHKDYRVETTCHYCGKLLKGRSKYYKHLKIHQPQCVKCEVCQKVFKSRVNLQIHMKRHSGVRSYTCETCSANFYTTGELCNHRRRVHFKSKSFKCDMCEYSAYTASLLKTHRSRHTQDNVVCLVCGFFVENAEKLVIHQKRHLEKNFICTLCEKAFFLRDSLRRHMVKKHNMAPHKQESDKVKVVSIKQECSVENNYVITLSPSRT